jgi:ATP-binding cassette subfamily B (MDR/TAP) protein 6
LFGSILVLRDGQIVEKGTFKELLNLDGLFASMWADQVSATEDPAISLAAGSVDRNTTPYHVENDDTSNGMPSSTGNLLAVQGEAPLVATPEKLSTLEFPVAESVVHDVPVPTSEPVAFPSSDPQDNAGEGERDSTKPIIEGHAAVDTPKTFPSSEEPQGSETKPAPAVTFGSDVNPSRTGTPDPDSEPKRKRISSQNFQRLARRISITAKRQSSSMIPNIPGLKRDSPRVSVDEGIRDTDSATGSVKGDDKDKKKKDKKDKSRKGTL